MLVFLKEPSKSPFAKLDQTGAYLSTLSKRLTMIGFGVTQSSWGADLSESLRKVAVTVRSCKEVDGRFPADIPEGRICTGGNSLSGECSGDAGGPLLDSSGIQLGIISDWQGCASEDTPSVHTPVHPYAADRGTELGYIGVRICAHSNSPPDYCDNILPTGPTPPPAPRPTPNPASPPFTPTHRPSPNPASPPLVPTRRPTQPPRTNWGPSERPPRRAPPRMGLSPMSMFPMSSMTMNMKGMNMAENAGGGMNMGMNTTKRNMTGAAKGTMKGAKTAKATTKAGRKAL